MKNPPWKYAAVSALGAVNTANAVRPFSRNGASSIPSFLTGWLTSELPLHTIGWQALATGVFGARHGFRSWPARAGLALTAGSWVALAGLHRRAARAGAIFDTALADVVGDTGEVHQRRVVDTANPFAHGRKRFIEERNVAYGEYGKRNLLDVWRPTDLDPDAKAPVLLQVHGGAWMIGKKEEQGNPLMTEMCERGWICVAINYRLSPKATWPDHIVDVKRAIAWIKDNIAQYGGDPDFVAITGGSAGGHLSSLAALSGNEPVFQPGFEDADTSVQAAVPFYGVYDFRNTAGHGRDDMKEFIEERVLKVSEADHTDIWDQASTSHWVGADAPPFLVIHGHNDSLVPVEQARWFATELRARSQSPVVYVELPDAQHAFEVFGSVRTRQTVHAVGKFLDHTHAQHASSFV